MFTILLSLAILVFVPFLYKANRNTKDVKVNTISIDQKDGLPARKKLNILHLSDLHLENISVSPRAVSFNKRSACGHHCSYRGFS